MYWVVFLCGSLIFYIMIAASVYGAKLLIQVCVAFIEEKKICGLSLLFSWVCPWWLSHPERNTIEKKWQSDFYFLHVCSWLQSTMPRPLEFSDIQQWAPTIFSWEANWIVLCAGDSSREISTPCFLAQFPPTFVCSAYSRCVQPIA